MNVIFRSLDDGSLVSVLHVVRLVVRSDKYEITYGKGYSPLVELYHFRFYSLLGVEL